MQPQEKPRIRVRTNLTSVQINDAQKQSIDQAYKVFKQSSGMPGVTKGQFLELIVNNDDQDYDCRPGGSCPVCNLKEGSLV